MSHLHHVLGRCACSSFSHGYFSYLFSVTTLSLVNPSGWNQKSLLRLCSMEWHVWLHCQPDSRHNFDHGGGRGLLRLRQPCTGCNPGVVLSKKGSAPQRREMSSSRQFRVRDRQHAAHLPAVCSSSCTRAVGHGGKMSSVSGAVTSSTATSRPSVVLSQTSHG